MKQRSLQPSSEGGNSAPIIVIEKRALIRESLARRLGEEFGCPVVSFPDIDSWQKASSGSGAQFILVSARENEHEALHALGASEIGANVMVLSNTTHVDDIVRASNAEPLWAPATKAYLYESPLPWRWSGGTMPAGAKTPPERTRRIAAKASSNVALVGI